ARPGGKYARALELLDRARRWAPEVPTKTGLMVGLGETTDELIDVLRDLRQVDCQILNIRQYLPPAVAHLPMTRYYTPDEFRDLIRIALDMGFGHVESGPLVRSSYHAHEQADSYDRSRACGAPASRPRAARGAPTRSRGDCHVRTVPAPSALLRRDRARQAS